MRMRTLRRVAFAAVAIVASVSAPVPGRAADIVIGVANWPSAIATAHLLKALVETKLGKTATLEEASLPELFAAADAGTVDILPEVWLPNYRAQVRSYVDKEHSVVLAPRGIPARQGLCTTKVAAEEYDLHSVEDLTKPETAGLLDTDQDGRGEIWIGADGWNSTNVERIRAKSYGYDKTMTLISADEPVAMAGLDVAVALGEPIVFYCYEPHHMFALHDLVMLEEPPHDPTKWVIRTPEDTPDWLEQSTAATAWPVSFIHTAYRSGFDDDAPEVVALLSNLDLEADAISDMTYALIVERRDPDAYAAEWIEANPDRVARWLAE
ncbi:glycine betaine ABC transporter substrate-binding protein [Amorphus sp. 3PC139-8]|uniref:ABC transporter substrate-binding protein n=1 Tax=Amorphus sp. 3PC139-8 TaxID=2735676 RepID=UPI00345D2669